MAEMQGQEGQEVSGLEQIVQLAQSGKPEVLAQIGQIASQLLVSQKAEMEGMSQEAPAEQAPAGLREQLMQAGGK